MGNGLNNKTNRFSNYNKIHSKKMNKFGVDSTAQQSPQSSAFTKNSQKNNIQNNKNSNFCQEPQKIVEKIKILTSNSYYESLKKDCKIKNLIKQKEEGLWANLEIFEELRLYIGEVLENCSLAGIIDKKVIEESHLLLTEINEKITLNKGLIDLDKKGVRSKIYKAMLILVENYHIIKFLKEEGVFQEGKWWNIRDEDYLRQIRQKLEKELENLLDKNEDSDDDDNESSESAESIHENVLKVERLKKWNTLAKEAEEKVEEKVQEKVEKSDEKKKYDELQKTEKLSPLSNPSSATFKNLQKPEFMQNSYQSPTHGKNVNNFITTEAHKFSNEKAKSESFSIGDFGLENEKTYQLENKKEENSRIIETNIENNETKEKNNLEPNEVKNDEIKKKLKPQLRLETNQTPTIIEDFNEELKSCKNQVVIGGIPQEITKIKQNDGNNITKIVITEPKDKINKENSGEKISEENSSGSNNSNKDFLQEFITEAQENIHEVVELLLERENFLKISDKNEKIVNELNLIQESLEKMRIFQTFLLKISNQNFTNEINEELKKNLSELKNTKELINLKYIQKENSNIPLYQQKDTRPSIEGMTQFKQSLDNFKTKLRQSINSLSTSKEGETNFKDLKGKAKNFEDIEKEVENELKLRSIHRKESYNSINCDTVYGCLDNACQDIETLMKRSIVNKEIINESVQKIDFSQQYLKTIYEKLIEKQDQIVYEDYDTKEDGRNENNLKVIRSTQDQLTLLMSFLNKTIENEG